MRTVIAPHAPSTSHRASPFPLPKSALAAPPQSSRHTPPRAQVNYYVQPAEEGSDAAAAEGGENADNNTQAGPGSSSGDTGKHGAAPGSPAAETSGSGAQASEQVQIEHAAATEVPELIPPPQPATASASSSAPSSALPSASSSSAPAAGQQQGPAAGDGDAANETLETVDLD